MLQAKLEPIGAAFAAIVQNSYHYWRPNINAPFLVWAEDQDVGFEANNVHEEQAIQGTVDYFTKQEFDPAIDAIQKALDDLGASWYLNSVQYEDETNLIHYEWVWGVY